MWNSRKFESGETGSSFGAGQSPKRKRAMWDWMERALLISGLALLAVYGVARIESILGSRAAIAKFEALTKSPDSTNLSGGEAYVSTPREPAPFPIPDSPETDFSLWDGHRIQAYKESFAKQPGDPIGVLRIPKIGLEVPLFDGTDDLTLNHAVGRIAGTAWPGEAGNMGIAGHRDGFFRGLKNISAGDSIELRTLQATESYVVDEIRIVTPDDVSVLRPRAVPSITLVTCYPFYFIGKAPQRYIVMASLSNAPKSGAEKIQLSPAISNLQSKKEKQ